MKRIAFVLLLAVALVLAFSGVAYANFGPHGGYANDTDACAGCHRAHTSFSAVTWTGIDNVGGRSALLVSDASNMTEFCYACHGDGAPGASTNVLMGVFDSGPTGARAGSTVNPLNPAATVFLASNSSYDATLNGGGFFELGANAAAPTMSSHEMPIAAGSGTKAQGLLVRWGNADLSAMGQFTCTDCHDPHGSSNYRLLKDIVNGVTAGGQIGNVADAKVKSNEQNFPANGFRTHSDGQIDMANYKPNYTVPQYRAAMTPGSDGMAFWCSACHSDYNVQNSSANYGTYETILGADGVTPVGTVGARMRHRHPVDVPLATGQGAGRALTVELVDDSGLPLEMPTPPADFTATKPWDSTGNVSCLTCHRAHGSDADSSGWAIAKLQTGPYGAVPVRVAKGAQATPGSAANVLGVNPNFSQAILRYPNRGVCERCHNK